LLFADTLYHEAGEGHAWREDLKKVIDETHRCKRIVADLLNFARQQEMLAQEVDVHEMLQQAINSVSHQPSFNQVQIIRQFAPGLPAIHADPAQFIQVSINLLNNAAEAMSQRGTITIHTRLATPHTVEIAISDTGCGIPEENLKKLFTPFFTTKPAGKGTGLGLSIVYGIIKMHRGQIAVTSEVGRGTTFTISLPLASAKERQIGQETSTGEVIQ
jgi:two-component system NtrC family sensor kinase